MLARLYGGGQTRVDVTAPFRLAEAPYQDKRRESLLSPTVDGRVLTEQRGFHQVRCRRVDGDAGLGQFQSPSTGEAVDRRLGGRIGAAQHDSVCAGNDVQLACL